MLEDGFRSHRYSDLVGNLRDNGFLTAEDVRKLLKEYTTTQKITFDCLDDEKGSISKVGSKEKNNFLCALNYIDE